MIRTGLQKYGYHSLNVVIEMFKGGVFIAYNLTEDEAWEISVSGLAQGKYGFIFEFMISSPKRNLVMSITTDISEWKINRPMPIKQAWRTLHQEHLEK